jgi:cation:H+ antiporter
LGGNAFDALNLVVGDIAYGEGSLYHAVDEDDLFVTGTGLLMTLVVIGGLLLRERQGPLGIGFEGVVLVLVYGTMVAVTLR